MGTKKDIDNLLQWMMEKRELPGVSLSVYQGTEKLYENYFGYQDMERTIPLTPDAMFRVYSMTKPISAVCGLIMYERGAFLMDDPVSEYLPEYKHLKLSVQKEDGTWEVEDSKEPMLMRHLFNMNVGFYDHSGSPTDLGMQEMLKKLGGSKFQANYTHLTEIKTLPMIPMLFEPGTKWQYGYGLDIMTGVVEEISGKSLGTFMKDNIFDPLEMNHTGHFFKPGWKENLMDCVIRRDGKVEKCDSILGDPIDSCHRPDAVYESASAGLLSTLNDYQKFCCMLANGGTWNGEKIIGRKTLAMMNQNLMKDEFFPTFNMSGNFNGYGYGYGVRTMMDPAAAGSNSGVGEFGWSGAAGTWMEIDPTDKLSAVFVMQEMMPDEHFYHHRIRAAVNGLAKF